MTHENLKLSSRIRKSFYLITMLCKYCVGEEGDLFKVCFGKLIQTFNFGLQSSLFTASPQRILKLPFCRIKDIT